MKIKEKSMFILIGLAVMFLLHCFSKEASALGVIYSGKNAVDFTVDSTCGLGGSGETSCDLYRDAVLVKSWSVGSNMAGKELYASDNTVPQSGQYAYKLKRCGWDMDADLKPFWGCYWQEPLLVDTAFENGTMHNSSDWLAKLGREKIIWTPANGVYSVLNVEIADGDLSILPNTQVVFDKTTDGYGTAGHLMATYPGLLIAEEVTFSNSDAIENHSPRHGQVILKGQSSPSLPLLKKCTFTNVELALEKAQNVRILENTIKSIPTAYTGAKYSYYAFLMNDSSGNLIQGNTIQTGSDVYTRDRVYGNSISGNGNIIKDNFFERLKVSGNFNTIKGNRVNGAGICTSQDHGFYIIKGNGNVIEGNVIEECGHGIQLYDSSNNLVTKNTIARNQGCGIHFRGNCSSNHIEYNIINGNGLAYAYCPAGILFTNSYATTYTDTHEDTASKDNAIVSNYFSANKIAIMFEPGYAGHTRNDFHDNTIEKSVDYGIYIGSTSATDKNHNNIFYNNIIKNNYRQVYGYGKDSAWNKTKTAGTSIVGGPFIGGNYWGDYTGNDADGDQIGEARYTVFGANVVDNLPLIMKDVMLFTGPKNPGEGEPVHPLTQPIPAEHIKIANSESSKNDISIDSMTFTYDGSGPAGDIVGAGLYRNADCTGGEGIQIGQTTILTGAGVTFSGLNETIPKGQHICYLLKYTFHDTISPCATYGAKINPQAISAKMGTEVIRVGGAEVFGRIHIGLPDIEIVGDTNRGGEIKKPLTSPLQVRAKGINNDNLQYWNAEFSVMNFPDSASGYKFDNNLLKNTVPFNGESKAETGFTLGDKAGLYTVQVKPVQAEGSNLTCPVEYVILSTFNVFAGGIELTAQFDGREGDGFGTFISTIEAKNKLTATVKLPPGDTRTTERLTFAIDGGTPVEGTLKNANPPAFEATLDMAVLKENSIIQTIAYMNNNTRMTQDSPFYAISFPSWLSYIINPTVQTYIKLEFQPDDQRYRISFTWPGDFIWQRPIESNIPFIGGNDNEAKATFTVAADYYINQNTGFHGEGRVNFEVLGKEGTVDGSIDAKFDKQFHLLPGATVKLGTSLNLPLPEKTLASKTILVYGVPVTLALTMGGNFKIFVNGAAVFDEHFKFEKMTFIPGTTLTLDITASASAVVGLAKIGVTGSPTGTLKIKLSYTTAAGIRKEAFGGDIIVPIKLFGSLFWNGIKGDLGETTLGPYTFGDQIGALSYPLGRKPESLEKRFYSTSGVAVDSAGRKLLVWTKDTSASADAINPEIAFKVDGGSGLGATGYITNNQLWEIDPAATFLSNGNALALWTSNKGDKSLNNLNDILSRQDIAWSYYNGSTWSSEALLTNDDTADGNVAVTYDPVADKTMALWVKSGASPMDKTAWTIDYSLFDGANRTWSLPQAIPGIPAGANLMPAITSDGKGTFTAVWVNDRDGEFSVINNTTSDGSNADNTNQDCNLYYSIYASGTWSQPAPLTSSNAFTELMPNATYTKDGDIALVWVRKEGNKDKLHGAIYKNSIWTAPFLIDEDGYLIEDPKISVDSNNKATIVYRKNKDGSDALYSIEKGLNGLIPQNVSSPRQLTYNNAAAMWLSAAATPDGKVFLSTTGVGKDDLSPPDIGDNIMAGVVDPVKKASLTGTNSEQPAGTPKYETLDAAIGINVQTAGKFSARAGLYGAAGDLIARTETPPQTLSSGNQTLTLSFSGRKINASGINGPYTIKDVVLLDNTLTPIAIENDASGFVTAAYTHGQFAETRLSADKTVYTGTYDTMKIKVIDGGRSSSVSVEVLSSAMGTPVTISLTPTSTGVFEGTLTFSTTAATGNTLKVEEAGIITIKYIDSDKGEWAITSVWVSGITTSLALSKGWNFVSLPQQPVNPAIEAVLNDISPDVRIVWGYDNEQKVWLRYKPSATSNQLSAIESGKGYWIYMNAPAALSLVGIDVSANIPLYAGWNLIGYNGTDGATVDTAISASLTGKWTIIWNWENGQWKARLAAGAVGQVNAPELTSFEKGKAYWIKMKQETEWTQ